MITGFEYKSNRRPIEPPINIEKKIIQTKIKLTRMENHT
jgi:hypothetical protein